MPPHQFFIPYAGPGPSGLPRAAPRARGPPRARASAVDSADAAPLRARSPRGRASSSVEDLGAAPRAPSPRGRASSVDDSSDDDLEGLIEARETSWSDEVAPSAPDAASWGRDDDSEDEPTRWAEDEPTRWAADDDSEEDAPVAEPTRWVRAWEAAVGGGDDDESDSESEEEEDAPPHKRRRTTAAARPRESSDSYSSRYYGVTYIEKRRNFQVRYTTAAGEQRSGGYFENEEDAAHAYNAVIRKLGLESSRKLNLADSAGRLVPKPEKPSAQDSSTSSKKSKYYGISYHRHNRSFQAQYRNASGSVKQALGPLGFRRALNILGPGHRAFDFHTGIWPKEDHRLLPYSRGSRARV